MQTLQDSSQKSIPEGSNNEKFSDFISFSYYSDSVFPSGFNDFIESKDQFTLECFGEI